MRQTEPIAIYVHVPFCAHHCAYCDFNTYVASSHDGLVADTVRAITADIRLAGAAQHGRAVSSVFLGGGTPTLLPPELAAEILDALTDSFDVAPDAEITSEANPGRDDAGRYANLRAAGVNRLSIGAQSFDDAQLARIDRQHSADDAVAAFRAARAAGFDNVSVDLMYGLPGQSCAAWSATLQRAAALAPEHVSLYSLTIEPGTRFERLRAGGRLDLPDEDAEAEMYEVAVADMGRAGYRQYEVSNFARPGRECRHNLVYWANTDYLGFGPGAVSFMEGRRWTRERLPARYVAKVRSGADTCVEEERLEGTRAVAETLMLGLRTAAGVAAGDVDRRFGIDLLSDYSRPIARLEARGLLNVQEGRLSPTPLGLRLANEIALEFLPG